MSHDASKETSTPTAAADQAKWVTARNPGPDYDTDVTVRHHRFRADEPVADGGHDAAPAPYDFLLSSVAICTAMTVRMYAKRKGWPLEEVTVRVRRRPPSEADAHAAEPGTPPLYTIEKRLELVGELSVEQRTRMLAIAEKCPVTQTLKAGVRFV